MGLAPWSLHKGRCRAFTQSRDRQHSKGAQDCAPLVYTRCIPPSPCVDVSRVNATNSRLEIRLYCDHLKPCTGESPTAFVGVSSPPLEMARWSGPVGPGHVTPQENGDLRPDTQAAEFCRQPS